MNTPAPNANGPLRRLHLICQAHLDPVWLWPWPDGFAEVLTTLQSAVDRLHECPDMRYTCSSLAFYRWVQQTDPRLFRAIRAMIDAGRWEVVGGWTIEPDTLLPGEVGLRRQGQLAQQWSREHLGVTASVGYCVDSFGHSAGLPSLLRAAGMRYYVFQRPRPREQPDLPNLFWWEAGDGSRVLVWRLATGYGQPTGCTGDSLEEQLRETWPHALAPDMNVGAWFVGVGNHGGGPAREHIQRLVTLRASGDPNLPELQFSTLAEFFADLERQAGFENVPVVRGELLHHARGCYAANTGFKRLHRRAERELITAEAMWRIGAGEAPWSEPAAEPPPLELCDAWWTLCFNQFHDVLPGTSVAPCYEQARDELGFVRRWARQVTVAATHTLARRTDTRDEPEGVLFLVNPLPWSRTAPVQVDAFVSPHGDSPITHLQTGDGEKLPLQWTAAEAGFGPHHKEWRKLTALVDMPPWGTRSLRLAHGEAPPRPSFTPVPDPLQALMDAARLVVVSDHADTWGHQVDRWDDERGELDLCREKRIDDGPLFHRRRRWMTWQRSSVTLDVIEWPALEAIELVLHINWQDRYSALKLELPLALDQSALTVRTPGTTVERPLDGDEWFWGDWLALTGSDRRLLVVSDGASAYDATPTRLRITLLRCVPYAQHDPVPHNDDAPAPFLDEGWQTARFWLAAPRVDAPSEALDRFAAERLTPIERMLDSAHEPAGAPAHDHATGVRGLPTL